MSRLMFASFLRQMAAPGPWSGQQGPGREARAEESIYEVKCQKTVVLQWVGENSGRFHLSLSHLIISSQHEDSSLGFLRLADYIVKHQNIRMGFRPALAGEPLLGG